MGVWIYNLMDKFVDDKGMGGWTNLLMGRDIY